MRFGACRSPSTHNPCLTNVTRPWIALRRDFNSKRMSEGLEPASQVASLTGDRYRLLVESVQDYGIFMLDPQGIIVSWNPGAERINGYKAEEIIGSHFSRFYPPEDLAWGKPQFELERAAADSRFEDEGWRLQKNGTRFWADVVITALVDAGTGEVTGYGQVIRDLTERKLADERLRQSEEQFRLLVESVDEYAIFMLEPNGKVATWNTGAEKAKGYTANDIIGSHFEQFYTPEDRAVGKPERMLSEAARDGHARDQGLRVRKDGTTFVADVLITAVHDSVGNLRGFTKVTRDITDQIRQREMETARITAERASKAKDDFLAVLSHELRTPLTPVLAAVSYLAENADRLSREELQESLRTIRRNTLLEAQLIDDLLDLTRISRGKIELRTEGVDVHVALKDAIAICSEDITTKGIDVSKHLDAVEHWAWADSTRLRQVFWNLINNAVKFTPVKGRITVRTSSRNDGRITLEVADTGIGIEPDQVARIFDAFEQGERTVTREFGGLGLGLAITRNLVELHHGTISASSAGRGKGATFVVTIPSIPNQVSGPPQPVEVRSKRYEGYAILLVDDHLDTRSILARLLSSGGYDIDVAGTVQEALEKLRSKRYHILISDIGLPDGSGHELMRDAKEIQPHLLGVALSGFGMDEDVQQSSAAGFTAHITKPIDISILRDSLAALPLETLN